MESVAVEWQSLEVKSPSLKHVVKTIAAIGIPYRIDGHRLNTLSVYLPATSANMLLAGTKATHLSLDGTRTQLPRTHVHIHGGAWRDPDLDSTSIEAAVAHAFAHYKEESQIDVIASINYTLSPFPTHATKPYDPIKDSHSDPAREGHYPRQASDVIRALLWLKQHGLADSSYLLSGHSAGACLAFQVALKAPSWWNETSERPPTPAAIIGLNGLYDLNELVHGLGPKHSHLRAVYQDFQTITFGDDQSKWPLYSPARFDVDDMSERLKQGEVPSLVLLDQSGEDQLVPENQRQRLELQLSLVDGLTVVRGHRCAGTHAAPWEQGYMIWETVKDVIGLLGSRL